MKKLALKIDIDTLVGTEEGVPNLLALLRRYNVGATFYFTLGRDRTGRAIKRIFRPGFLEKLRRSSVIEHYGIKTLCYGTLLPSPHISDRCLEVMQSVSDSGFDVGVHCTEHILWQDHVAKRNRKWTESIMREEISLFSHVFGFKPHSRASAGWQMNSDAYRLEQILDYKFASDTRGTNPFIPVINGEIGGCVQIPTTLPTLDELIGRNDLIDQVVNSENVTSVLTSLTENSDRKLEVFTLHAELEGRRLLPVFEKLLATWLSQGYQLLSMFDVFKELDTENLPYHQVYMNRIPGRSGLLSTQGNIAFV